MIKKETKQKYNYITAKLIKCNVNNKYDPFSAAKKAFNYKKIKEDKREVKKRKKTAFMLN